MIISLISYLIVITPWLWDIPFHKLSASAAFHVKSQPLKPFQEKYYSQLIFYSFQPDQLWYQSVINTSYHYQFLEKYPTIDSAIERNELVDFMKTFDVSYQQQNGSVIQRIFLYSDSLTQSLVCNDTIRVVKYSGYINHFVSDLIAPFHLINITDDKELSTLHDYLEYELTLVAAPSALTIADRRGQELTTIIKEAMFIGQKNTEMVLNIHQTYKKEKVKRKVKTIINKAYKDANKDPYLKLIESALMESASLTVAIWDYSLKKSKNME